MSKKYLVYLAMALAVTVAGCAFIPGMAPKEKQMPDEIRSLLTSPTSAPVAQVQVSGGGEIAVIKPFDLDGTRWMEYRQAGQPGTSTVRLEYGSGSGGNARMISIKRTQTSGDAASVNSFNGGTLYSFSKSNRQSSTTSNLVPFEQIRADDPILYAEDLSASATGAESITVPKGTYDCKKYMASFKGADATYWGAPGVPVPVKIYTACDGTTLELVDWG